MTVNIHLGYIPAIDINSSLAMDEDDPIGDALKSRRIPHGRSGKGRGRGKGASSFNVLKAINDYAVQVGSKDVHPSPDQDGGQTSWLLIQGLTPSEDGLVASFKFGTAISGVGILSGSRKDLRRIVEDVERREEDEDDKEEEDQPREGEDNEEEEEEEIDEDDDTHSQTTQESREERLNRLTKTFEKNSFRNPKFWMRWKGHVTKSDDENAEIETDMSYIVFSGNDCRTFEGTLTSKMLGWKNVKLEGRKTRSQVSKTFTMEEARDFWQNVGYLSEKLSKD
ncbi:Hypothetical predicted protein [Lecanosticta acicola]|uniref:Uncharacterized protein n=1 Tax=Lecanosticta acicola TaxID=111012 RepID=A0AAI8YPL9_9PEZI|nr:Hypothetical predicted protein [Lecanosticta acicola]